MAHIHEKIDFTVEVFIVYKDKVLLRKHDKYGCWLSIGGHIELDEDPNEAAVREVKEEVGLDVVLFDTRDFIRENETFKELIPPVSLNRHRISETHEHVSMLYFAKALTDAVVPEKATDEWQWCRAEEVESLEGIESDVLHYGKRAIAVVSKMVY